MSRCLGSPITPERSAALPARIPGAATHGDRPFLIADRRINSGIGRVESRDRTAEENAAKLFTAAFEPTSARQASGEEAKNRNENGTVSRAAPNASGHCCRATRATRCKRSSRSGAAAAAQHSSAAIPIPCGIGCSGVGLILKRDIQALNDRLLHGRYCHKPHSGACARNCTATAAGCGFP